MQTRYPDPFKGNTKLRAVFHLGEKRDLSRHAFTQKLPPKPPQMPATDTKPLAPPGRENILHRLQELPQAGWAPRKHTHIITTTPLLR